jgi:AcrR family transcriptional regulator
MKTMAGGRPREFDAQATLDRVVHVFWQHGYEGSSMAMLELATGLNKPSLYAAFGDKQALFSAAFARYRKLQGRFTANCLNHVSARDGVELLLLALVDSQTQPGLPHGCLMVHGSLVGSSAGDAVRQELRTARAAIEAAVRERLVRAQHAGELADDIDTADLARYITTLIKGLAVQAADGATRARLHRVVKLAMRAWPPQAPQGTG